MKFKILLVVILVSVFRIHAQNQESDNTFKRVKISNVDQITLEKLGTHGIDLECGAIISDSNLTIELTGSELHILEDLNISFIIEIDDLTKFYSERATADASKAAREFKAERAKSLKLKAKGVSNKSITELLNNVGQHTGENEIPWTQPVNWNLNPNILNEDNLSDPSNSTPHFGGCLTYTQVLQELDDMRTYSENNGLDIISERLDASPTNQKTLGGRTVYYVRISDNPDVDENEPETLYQSLIHSREAASLMLQLYYMWYILENYNSDPAIRNLVNNQELYFIPIFNPDGFVYNETVAPNGGGGQRKNMNTSAPGSCSTYLEGIDLNRNSAYYWGNGGSSTDACNQTYMGTGPFSENETQIMRDFFGLHDFKLALNHHSYKNAMLHAYAGVDQGYPVIDAGSDNNSSNDNDTTNDYSIADMYSKYNHDMTYYNRYMYGPSTQVTSLNSGNMNDWMLGGPAGTSGVTGTPTGTGSGKFTLAWTPENGLYSEGSGGPGGSYSGFWPAPSLYDDIARRAMRANFMAAYFSGKYAKLHEMTPSNITADGNLTFGLENLGRTASNFTITVTPISGLASVGAAVTESGMNILEQRNVNIPFTLNGGIQANDKIEYKVTLTNDYATENVLYEANIVKYYQPTEIFTEGPNENLSNWTGSGWSTTGTTFSGTTALSSGSYTGSATRIIQLNGTYDLTGGSEFLIQYFAKWDIERSFDYVQIEASTNGSSWTPLIGRYTKPGAPDANNNYSNKSGTNNDFQPDYQHLYDGDTAGKWVMEEITVSPISNSAFYNQGTVYLRFEFRSDSNNREDSYVNSDFEGFQFDDFRIIKAPCNLTEPINLTADAIAVSTATINWDDDGFTYDLRYRETGSSTWTDVLGIVTNTTDLSGLTALTEYEVQVRSSCDGLFSNYTNSITFTTLTAPPCTGTEFSDFSTGYSESFETDLGNWTNETGDDIEWTRDSGGTPSNNTGPSTGSNGLFYLYVEASDANSGNGFPVDGNPQKNADLISPCFDLTGYKDAVISFDYYIYGGDLGSENDGNGILKIEISEDNGLNYVEVFSVDPLSDNNWISVNLPLNSSYNSKTIKIKVSGTTGSSWSSDVAIDSFSMSATEDLSLGIQDELLSKFNVYPNPSSNGIVNLDIPNDINEFTISVSTLLGQKVYSEEVKLYNTNKHLVNLNKLSSGVYLLTVSTDLGKASKKIIVE